jgi:hypothetical protein
MVAMLLTTARARYLCRGLHSSASTCTYIRHAAREMASPTQPRLSLVKFAVDNLRLPASHLLTGTNTLA